MTSDRSVFMRPVLIDSSNKDFTIGSAGAPVTCALATGVYPNVAAVLNEMTTKVDAGMVDVIIDGDMEAADTSAYGSADAALTKEHGSPHSGIHCLRITATAGAGVKYPRAYETVWVVGKSYRISGVAKSDGTMIPIFFTVNPFPWTGTTSTSCQHFSVDWVSDGVDCMFGFTVTDPAGTEYVEFDDITVYNLTDGCPVDFTPTFDSNFKVQLDATTDFVLTWTDSALRDLLGFTGTLTGDNTYTATYTPQGTWFPLRVRADNDEWYQNHKDQWKGSTARNGNTVGLRTGSAIYSTSIEYNALPDYECLRARALTDYQDVRSLDYFLDQSREIYSAYNQVSLAGFYYFPDYTAVTIGASATYTSGDCTQFHRTASPSTFVFCNFDSTYYPQYKPTWTAGQCEFYNCDVNIHTATAPTWTGA